MRTISVIIVGILILVMFVAKCSSIDTEEGAEEQTQEEVSSENSDDTTDSDEKGVWKNAPTKRQATRPVRDFESMTEQTISRPRKPTKKPYPVLQSYEPLKDNGETIQTPEPQVEDLFKHQP